jgi:lysophospholipase L1-like esterase
LTAARSAHSRKDAIMHARRLYNTVALAGLVAGLGAGIPTPHVAEARSALLRRTVVVGDSILAGFGDGGLRRNGPMGQRDAAPRLIARRAGVKLPQPLMTSPGFPPPYRIVDRDRDGQLDPGEIVRRSSGIGFRADADVSARNLAVPGESVASVFDQVQADDLAGHLFTGDASGEEIMKFAILGLPLRDEGVSQVRRTRDLSPSFILVWLGNNDVLGMATGTNPNGADESPAAFGQMYRRLLNALADTGAPMAVANLPDVTQIAALRPAAGEVTECRRGDGTILPVAADDLLPLDLDTSTLPRPACGDVLDAEERASIRATVQAFNAEIDAAITEIEVSRGVPVARVDAFGLFDAIATSGYDVRGDGTFVLRTKYLGGIFGLDGVHPTRAAHAIIANAFLDAIETRFGESIPRVNVAAVASRDPRVRNRFEPAGEAPFGLFAPDEIQNLLPNALQNLADDGGDFLDDLDHAFSDFFDHLF